MSAVTAGGATPPAVAPPPGNPRFALFDSLRGIAVLCIIAFHVGSLTGALDAGLPGDGLAVLGPQALVQFFVISGFLLYRPFVAARAAGRPVPSIRRYARRRVLRIVPGYWVALTLLAIYPGLVGVFGPHWWRFYGFMQVYWSDSVAGGIPVAWSLCVEATYYLLLPLWAIAVRRVLPGGSWMRAELVSLAAVALGGAAVQVLAARNVVGDLVATTLLGQCVWLALGMALAVASVANAHAGARPRAVRAVVAHPLACWALAAAAFVALTLVLHPGGLLGIVQSLTSRQPVSRTLEALALGICLNALIVAPAIFGETAGGIPRRLLAWAPLTWLGVVSYGVYLYHLATVEWLSLRSDPLHFRARGLGLMFHVDRFTTLVMFALAVLVSAMLAALSYRFVELPFLRRKEPQAASAAAPRAG